MLKTSLIHSEILKTLAQCGHGDKILIVDGNYPIDSCTNGNTNRVYLNLTHGIPLVTDVLKVFRDTIAIEKVEIMVPEDESWLPIHHEFQEIITSVEKLDPLQRFEFYEACKKDNVKLAVATGEDRVYGNVLLTIGVVKHNN